MLIYSRQPVYSCDVDWIATQILEWIFPFSISPASNMHADKFADKQVERELPNQPQVRKCSQYLAGMLRLSVEGYSYVHHTSHQESVNLTMSQQAW